MIDRRADQEREGEQDEEGEEEHREQNKRMRLATAETLARPRAPVTREMIRKMTAYLNMSALRAALPSTDKRRSRSPTGCGTGMGGKASVAIAGAA